MQPIGYHVTCRLKDSRVIAPTPEKRRLLSRTVLEKTADHQLLAFNGPDTHLHMELVEPRAVCGRVVQHTEITIKARLKIPIGFDEAEFKPILSQGHLYRAFHYILSQEPHHGLVRDPFHEASNLSDLLGLRVLGAFTARHVRELLPRIKREDLLPHLGVLETTAWKPASGPIELLVPATLAAAGLQTLTRDAEGRRARRAAIEVAGPDVPRGLLASMLAIERTTLRRSSQLEVDEKLIKAIALQIGLRRIVAGQPVGHF
jgi:hypothetical protein